MSKAMKKSNSVRKTTKDLKKLKIGDKGTKKGVGKNSAQTKGEQTLTLPKWDKSDSEDDGCINGQTELNSIRAQLEECFERKTNIPDKELQIYNNTFCEIFQSLLPKIQRNTSRVRCLDPVYVGSSFDGLMVQPSINYEVQIPISIVGRVVVEEVKPGFVALRVPAVASGKANEDRWIGWRSHDNYLSPVLANRMFYKFVLQWASLRDLPGVSVNDYEPGKDVRILVGDNITIVITPMIDLKRKENPYPLVAKPASYESDPASEYFWRISCFERETTLLKIIEKADDGCRCRTLKILKALRHDDDALRHLTTYQMKTVLLHMCDGEIDKLKWQKHKIESCFAALIRELLNAVQQKRLNHFVLEDVNLLEHVPDHVLTSAENRLKILCSREKELARLLAK
ncbi:cyclic GMP-AMP synthase-like [Saccoglossus kowalevskii]|uniref:Mitochondrial dynamics protein MID51-like n=1 Tax=Saccoglossus kowalevskii TaxID=10224 RepID=A0ABM0MYA0_SACKO|nr:PREDICTED: mitochondrial dynamics protein MID51-like [Saccoglossus kowalevskii]